MTLAACKQVVARSKRIVFFGGAGVSTESGIPDFRSADGLFAETSNAYYSPEQILSRDFFMREPALFYDFYRSKLIHSQAQPNRAHQVLAQWERAGILQGVITQNIDGLHQAAGSDKVAELHGSIHRNYCMSCSAFFPLDAVAHAPEHEVPACATCGGTLKPDVVLYQETLDDEVIERAVSWLNTADLLIVAGTSLRVYPAAGLLRFYKGTDIVLINKTPTEYDQQARFVFHESVGEVLSQLASD